MSKANLKGNKSRATPADVSFADPIITVTLSSEHGSKSLMFPDPCHPRTDVDDEQEPSNASIGSMNLRDRAQSPSDVPYTHVLDGAPVRTACERADAANVLLAAHH